MTRMEDRAEDPEVSPKGEVARGVLYPQQAAQAFEHFRLLPCTELKRYIELFWFIRWDLPVDQSYTQATLPHPNVHLVFDSRQSQIWGAMTGNFKYTMEGKGQVVGIKFRAGAFHCLYQKPLGKLQDQTLPLNSLFGSEVLGLEQRLLTSQDPYQQQKWLEAFLIKEYQDKGSAENNQNIDQLDKMLHFIQSQQTLTKVGELAKAFAMSKRSLQRLFHHKVGISPKWVIGRYRLHEALAQIETGDTFDWTALALDLGYFDQSHFIRDFKALVGESPGSYLKLKGEKAPPLQNTGK